MLISSLFSLRRSAYAQVTPAVTSAVTSPEILDISSPLTKSAVFHIPKKIKHGCEDSNGKEADLVRNFAQFKLCWYFYDEKKTKRRGRTKTLGYFDAERIISSRQNSQVRMLSLLFVFHAVYNIKWHNLIWLQAHIYLKWFKSRIGENSKDCLCLRKERNIYFITVKRTMICDLYKTEGE